MPGVLGFLLIGCTPQLRPQQTPLGRREVPPVHLREGYPSHLPLAGPQPGTLARDYTVVSIFGVT